MKSDDKYKWHDLRKNPNDLPESKEVVLTMESAFSFPMTADASYVKTENGVYAWRYIEPFVEEEDNE